MGAPEPVSIAWLVQTKVEPPRPHTDTLPRPRLLQQLQAAVERCSLTLVSAPAGYGKTTLLSHLDQLRPGLPLAWVTLEAEENDPMRFIATLIAALQRLDPEFGRSVLRLTGGAADPESTLRRAMAGLVNEVMGRLTEPFLLVLDDLHFVTEPAVYGALAYLLTHQPPQMRVVIGTRHQPPLPLARLAARRQLAELTQQDLSFTPDEAAALLNQTLGLRLDAGELAAMQQRTEGWAVGLCLLASSLERLPSRGARAAFLTSMAQTDRYVFDFLIEEVLRHQPPALRRFLLQTSILAELTPAACAAVTGRSDAAAILGELYQRNLFLVAAGDTTSTYRYHALFAAFLEGELRRESPDDLAELHYRAAAAQSTPSRAIGHYLAAGRWAEAAAQIEAATDPLLEQGICETLRGWYRALPESVQSGRPRLLQLQGRVEIHRGDYPLAQRLLSRALAAMRALGERANEAQALNGLLTVAAQNGDLVEVARLIEEMRPLTLHPIGQTTVLTLQAWQHLFAGEWALAAAAMAKGLAHPQELQDPTSAMTASVFTSPLIAAAPGCLELVERFAAFALGIAPPDSPLQLSVTEQSVWLRLWRGEIAEALAMGEAAAGLRQRLGGYPVVGADLAAFLATTYAALGRPAEGRQAAATLLERLEGAPAFQRPYWLHTAGRTLCLTGDLPGARRILARLRAEEAGLGRILTPYLGAHLEGLLALTERRLPAAEALLSRGAQLEEQVPIATACGSARLLLAQLYAESGRVSEARRIVGQVLTAWAAAGVPGRVLTDGPAVLPVLRLAAEGGVHLAALALGLFGESAQLGAAQAISMGLGNAAAALSVGTNAATSQASLPESLTPRELDVLQHLAVGAANREIARALYLGEETIKSHVARILRKLDATSRTQAVARGRALGLCE